MTDLVARLARLGALVLILVVLVVTLLARGCGWGVSLDLDVLSGPMEATSVIRRRISFLGSN